MARFERDGVVLAYGSAGRGDHAAVVLLHGLGSTRSTWTRVAEALAGRFRVFSIDLRGHGDSSHAPGTYQLDHYGGDVVAFCESVVVKPAVLVGHSLGGVVAAVVARKRPDLVRGVFLEDPPLFRGDPSEPAIGPFLAIFTLLHQVLADMQARNAPVEEYEAMLKAAPAMGGGRTFGDVLGEEGTRAQARAMASLDPEIYTPAIDRSGLAGADPSTPLPCPVRVVRADPALGAAFTPEDESRFLVTNPHATVDVVEGASHLIHDEQPDRFASDLLAFLDGLKARSGEDRLPVQPGN
jgi:pimeloyl-ACP methyl ester carboxylesterase